MVNELDALVNVDLETRVPKENLTSLNLIRIGTSGSIHPEAFVDEIVVYRTRTGTDALGMYMNTKASSTICLLPGPI